MQDHAGGAGLDGSSGRMEMVKRIRKELKIILEELKWMYLQVG